MSAADRDYQPGALVVIDAQGRETLDTVERLTLTQMVTRGGRRFMRRTGREVGWGDFYSAPVAYIPTERRADEVRRNDAERAIRHYADRFNRDRSVQAATRLGAALRVWLRLNGRIEGGADEDRP